MRSTLKATGWAGVIVLVAISLAGLAAAERGEGGDGNAKGDNLEHLMKSMEKGLNAIKKDVKDEKQQARMLQLVAQFEKDVLTAKGIIPGRIARKTGDEKDKAIAEYRGMMSNVLRQALDLEDSISENKPDEALKVIDQIVEIEKQGHKEFRPKEH